MLRRVPEYRIFFCPANNFSISFCRNLEKIYNFAPLSKGGNSSVGRAEASQASGHEFEPRLPLLEEMILNIPFLMVAGAIRPPFFISLVMNKELKDKLRLLAERYETEDFLLEDPIQIPHRYRGGSKADIEISALVTSWIATGNRKAIVKAADRIDRELFGGRPLQYILGGEWERFRGDKSSFYRYYSHHDFYLLCQALRPVYIGSDSLEDHLYGYSSGLSPLERLQLALGHINGMPNRASSSEAKKMCMFLRWMVRRDSVVDFGIWQRFAPAELIIPLDTHVHRIATDLGLTNGRKCIRTARQVTDALREVWPDDPAKGDFALFGYGVNEP